MASLVGDAVLWVDEPSITSGREVLVRQRLPIVVSATALVVAVFGSTGIGHAAMQAVVPQYSKTAGYAKFAGNSTQLNGRRSTLAGAPGSIPVVGKNGKLPVTIGAVGPQGPAGPAGAAGAKGAVGAPGISGYEIATRKFPGGGSGNQTTPCPSGKKVIGGGISIEAAGGGHGNSVVNDSYPAGETGWGATWEKAPVGWTITISAICGDVES
jgi:hypothetical protein